jgi:hypothetical protein
MEAPEAKTTAENVANYFASGKVKASATLCIDNDSIVRSVDDGDVAWAAPGANSDGLQLELAGYANQGKEGWLDVYSRAVIENAAKATAQYCVKYGLPVKHLTPAQINAGEKGIVSHADVNATYHKSTHTDPGPTFPWDLLLERLPYYQNNRTWPKKAGPSNASVPAKAGAAMSGGLTVENVKSMQRACKVTADGVWGAGTDGAFGVLIEGKHSTKVEAVNLQHVSGAKADGVWGPESERLFLASKKAFQGGLKVPVTGNMDAQTIDAYKKARAKFHK